VPSKYDICVTPFQVLSLIPQLREVHALAHAPRCAVFQALLRPADHTSSALPLAPSSSDDRATAAAALRALRSVASPPLCLALQVALHNWCFTSLTCEFTSPTCELTSPVCKLTSPHVNSPPPKYELNSPHVNSHRRNSTARS
jgi:hypothetical protein